jgi:A/G-specific adenine glycosylase
VDALTTQDRPAAARFESQELRAALAPWYGRHGRHALPWRLSRDPYAVLVSEVMLQQTQVERVLPYYDAWHARWPTVGSLAAASEAQVIRAWAGLGYNRRALHLVRAARAVAAGGGSFPADEAALRQLPGVGPYTAAAIACFAGGARTFVADTNIGRVLARAFLGAAGHREVPPRELRAAGEALLPDSGARDHNLALMDLGALVCTVRNPGCDACPLHQRCAWRAGGYPTATASPKRLPKFETTARFARGRIIDALRGHPALPEREIAGQLPLALAAKVGGYLAALEREGLVARCGEGWGLPGQGRMSIASPKL